MPASGTSTYFDPDDYRLKFRGARINLVFGHLRNFTVRLTRVELSHLHLHRVEEKLSRIAYMSLAPELVFFSFPTQRNPNLEWGGVKVRLGEIVWHGRGERIHQRTTGDSRWGFVSLTNDHFAGYGRALAESNLIPSPLGRVIRPSGPARAELLRLHARACDLAETKPKMIEHREIARAMEQDIVHALFNCLTANDVREPTLAWRNHSNIMLRFEEVLAANYNRALHVPDVCAAIGISERTLRNCCVEFLGIGPSEYFRLQRLAMVRAALGSADPCKANVGELARLYGFSELGRFAIRYRAAFGEAPSTTLRRQPFSSAGITRNAEYA